MVFRAKQSVSLITNGTAYNTCIGRDTLQCLFKMLATLEVAKQKDVKSKFKVLSCLKSEQPCTFQVWR